MQFEAFPEEYRAAVRAVAAAMSATGREPGEYTAEVSPTAEGLLEVYARHDSHPAGGSWRGDPCGRCCVARYDSSTGAVPRVLGIR
jgi:hypothetical protein